MRSFVGGDNPYILTGFDVINPSDAIGTQNISIRVADSVAYYPGSLAGPFFHGLEEGNALAAPLIPELRKNSTNYVYLTLTTTEAAKDTRAFWDPDKEAGVGGEFTQDVNTQTALSAAINVSVSAFPENTIPVCKVVVGANFIDSIEDARDMMFRLGSGGLNPNPLSTYAFRNEPSSIYARTEPNTLMSNALDPNSFQGGDKNIQSLKEWMDVVMTKLLELSGTTYWYEDTASFSLINIFKDALSTSIKSKGEWQSSASTPGLLTWTEDVVIQSVSDDKDIIIRAGNKTLANNQVMYLNQNRGDEINTGNVPVTWFNAVNYVNGTLGSFESLTKGDWVKKANDVDNLYLRVEEFYASSNLGGGVTSAANALSIKLSSTYGGISETVQGVYVQGEYLTTDVIIGDRDNSLLTDAGGDLYWIAMRSDTVINVSDITSTQLSIDIETHDGIKARCTSAGHGLIDKQRITIAGSTNFDGVHQIEVQDANIFYINISGGPFADELAQAAFLATVTTSARSTTEGYLLESANHSFNIDQSIIVTDTTNYNGTFQVFPLTDTTFSIPVSSLIASELTGTSTSVEMHVRTDLGPTKLNQGENKSIGEVESANIMSFIGMDNTTQTYPLYSILPSYNTINGHVNFNSDITDNLTQRVSKLTTMMADKAQDKTIQFIPIDVDIIANTTNVGAQDITFASLAAGTPILDVQMLGSDNNGTLDLTTTISLNTNQVAYIDVDRNAGFTLASTTVVDIADMPVGENIFVIAIRLLGNNIYLWDGTIVLSGESIEYKNHEKKVIRQNANLDLLEGDTWSWNLASNTLSWGTDAYIQVPGADKTRNTIQAGNVILSADKQVAYVDINRNTGAIANLVVATADVSILSLPNPNRVIIAQRINDEVIVRGNKLALGALADAAFQNVNLKLIEGGTWSWEVSGANELTSSTDSYIQIPGLTKERNTILAQTITLTTDDEVAYVSINRDSGATSNLTVTVADEATVAISDNIIIIARRVNNDIIVGTASDSLQSGEFLELDSALAEINKYHGQLSVTPETTISKRIKISGSDILKLSGSQLSLEQENLLLSFDGAVINFETGQVFEADGTTPFLAGANDFTPFIIGTNEYFYYSVSVLPNTANADNTISGQVLVIPSSSSNAVLNSAPKAPFPGIGLKLANVYVQENGAAGVLNIDYVNIIQLGVGSGSGGSGSGFVKVDYHDPISTILPTGTSVTIDGQAGINGDMVLFSNLITNNNKIYKLSGVGTAVAWDTTLDFNLGTPEDGDSVVVLSGDSFRDSRGFFDGTTWIFNDAIRFFTGADYWEQSSLKTSDITASTTGDIFTVNLIGSENIIIDYSLFIGTDKETGQIILTSDGTNVQISRSSVNITAFDVDIFADIVTTTLRLRYTNNEVSSGAIKYSVKRWSNSSGGPGGLPSYSGSTGSTVIAAGNTSDIQYKNGSGNLEGDSDFQWSTSNKQLSLGGLKIDKLLGPLVINDNQVAPATIVSYAATTFKSVILEYSIERNNENRVGRLLVVNNGTTVSLTDDSTDTGGIGISDIDIPITATLSGGNVLIQYTSTSTGFIGNFNYSSRRW